MFRLALLIGIAALLVSPFLITSWYVDTRGIVIPGTVYSKREDIRVSYQSWTRTAQVTIQYEEPESLSYAFLSTEFTPEQYDALHLRQKVKLHFLLRKDIPQFPFSHTLRQMHVLPMVRLADQKTFSGLERQLTLRARRNTSIFLLAAIVLWLWRIAEVPGFKWAVGMLLIAGIAWLYFSDFPRPTAAPVQQVKQAEGRIKTLERIAHLFRDNRSRGIDANQPIDVIAVEFIPAAWTEPVLAVDLIDSGSAPGLVEGSTVAVNYEANHPRTAQLQAGTRTFLRSNYLGLLGYALICLAIGAALLLGMKTFCFLFKRLTG